MISKSEIVKLLQNDLVKAINTKIVYQYAKFDIALENILLNQTLRFSSPTTFNDPFDCNEKLLEFETSKDLVNKTISELNYKLSRKERRELKRNFNSRPNQQTFMRERRAEFKLTCFSEKFDEILMWSHYADKHSGICVGFNFPHQYDEKFIMCPVRYLEELKPLDGATDLHRVTLYWLTAKSIRWKYEAEIRAITKSRTNDLFENIKFESKYVKEIIFGCNVSTKKINDSIQKLKKSSLPFDNITIKQMEIDERNFLLKEKILKPSA